MKPLLEHPRPRLHSISVLLLGSVALFVPETLARQNVAPVRPHARDGRVPILELPFTIEDCGSYFLTGCLSGVSGSAGITVAADDVTIDLNGFALLGVPGSQAGIAVQAGRSNVAVSGGTLRGWGTCAVDASGATDVRLRDLCATGNAGSGLCLGAGGILRDCTASENGGSGLSVGPGGIVSRCASSGNATGIVAEFLPSSAATGSVIESCTVQSNRFVGIFAGVGTLVRDCAVTKNGLGGVSVGIGCNVVGCTVIQNGEDGINAPDSLVRGNSSRGNAGAQISAASSTLVENHQ